MIAFFLQRMLPNANALDLRLIAYGALIYLFSGIGQTYLFQFIRPDVMDSFGLSDAQFGQFYMIGTLASGFLIMFSGRIFDWFDLRLVTVIAVVGAALSCFFFASNSVLWLVIPTFFLQRQFGQGLMNHIPNAAMSRYFSHLRGRATSLCNASYSLGEMTLPLLASILIIPLFGWRGLYVILGAILLVGVLPLAQFLLRGHDERQRLYEEQQSQELDEHNTAKPGSRRRQWTLFEVLSHYRIWMLLPTLLAPSFIFTGLAMFGLEFATQLGVQTTTWAWLWGGYAMLQLCTTFLWGWLVDRFTATRLVPLVALPMALALVLVQPFEGVVIAATMLLLWGLCQGFTAVVLGPVFAELYGVKHLGAIKAFYTSVMVIASAGGPFVVGSLLDAGWSLKNISLSFAIYIVCASFVSMLAVLSTSVKPLRH